MDTTQRGLTGDKNLTAINELITAQEALNCEFQDSHITYVSKSVVNQVTWEMYDDDTVPNPLTLKIKGDAAPPKSKKVWEGVMAVENNLVVVVAYRDN